MTKLIVRAPLPDRQMDRLPKERLPEFGRPVPKSRNKVANLSEQAQPEVCQRYFHVQPKRLPGVEELGEVTWSGLASP